MENPLPNLFSIHPRGDLQGHYKLVSWNLTKVCCLALALKQNGLGSAHLSSRPQTTHNPSISVSGPRSPVLQKDKSPT